MKRYYWNEYNFTGTKPELAKALRREQMYDLCQCGKTSAKACL